MRSTTSRTRHGGLTPNSLSNVLALFIPPVYGRSAASLPAPCPHNSLKTHISYFGPYTIHADDGYIVHHRSGCWFPSCMDTDAQRFYEFGERTLTLQPPAREVDGSMVQDSLVWERIGE